MQEPHCVPHRNCSPRRSTLPAPAAIACPISRSPTSQQVQIKRPLDGVPGSNPASSGARSSTRLAVSWADSQSRSGRRVALGIEIAGIDQLVSTQYPRRENRRCPHPGTGRSVAARDRRSCEHDWRTSSASPMRPRQTASGTHRELRSATSTPTPAACGSSRVSKQPQLLTVTRRQGNPGIFQLGLT